MKKMDLFPMKEMDNTYFSLSIENFRISELLLDSLDIYF